MKLTEAERETAARMLAEKMMMPDWQDLRPFTRAKYRTAILTMERIFWAATRALEQSQSQEGK